MPIGGRAVKTIPLSRGKVALVDDADFEWLSQWKWSVCNDDGYAVRNTRVDGKQVNIRMHRLLLGAGPGQMVDHANGDTLDNRRANLRLCTMTESNRNRRSRPGRGLTHRGVTLRQGKYYARIAVARRQQWLGPFDTEEAAASAYDAKARELFGAFARL